eukprot:COSAG02_NODE_15658_length_1151_cov_0.942966_2_plen_115_part_00
MMTSARCVQEIYRAGQGEIAATQNSVLQSACQIIIFLDLDQPISDSAFEAKCTITSKAGLAPWHFPNSVRLAQLLRTLSRTFGRPEVCGWRLEYCEFPVGHIVVPVPRVGYTKL